MKRREFLVSSGALLVAQGAIAQSPGTVRRLGILSADRQDRAEGALKLLQTRLAELGWRRGDNLSIDFARADAIPALGELAAGLVRARPDVLLAVGPYAAFSLKEATASIPVVFVAVANPVERGLVSTLARPGGNVTGVSHFASQGLWGKNAEIMKELLPRAERLALLINLDHPGFRDVERWQLHLTSLGRQLKVAVSSVGARSADEVPLAIEAAIRERIDGLIVVPDSVLDSAFERIAQLAAKNRLPVSYPYLGMVEAGGLLSYSTDIVAVVRRGADFVDKILKGAKPADLPVEQPTMFQLAINLRTARAMGLSVPQSLLLRADRVIE